ncbi:MAG: UDP-N-acetylglucosamine 1-carboxyvinyltransferase [Fibromonadaceae bacterium]|jgi:UDP-N-acetylglucosamine 1-carboxyvinyltransferase|nr:UDP-N-acetylglucosamine 1-carboxyvinyltransferase [Fibromonadaceae bacterium]
MDSFLVSSNGPLKGSVKISGAKNAVLPVMAAAMLTDGVSRIGNVPHLKDMRTMADVLRVTGCRIKESENELSIDSSDINHLEAPYELVKTMRASFYVLGPLVAKFGRCRVSLPGGCAWGPRPVDLHLKGLEALGAKINITHGYVEAICDGRLKGNTFSFPISSVGATANILMAATLAEGSTVLQNSLIEPEITALAEYLTDMGAKIDGIGTRTLIVHGVEKLNPGNGDTIADRIEAGTFLAAAAITRGKVKVTNMVPAHQGALLECFKNIGCKISQGDDWVELDAEGMSLSPAHITTLPYPGFPTDMQAQLMAVLASIKGTSSVRDTIYSDRFKHVSELERLGADISLKEDTAIITGGSPLSGAPVMASDLRASAALVLAGLAASGQTKISRIYHLDRGYENFEGKLALLGANVERVS